MAVLVCLWLDVGVTMETEAQTLRLGTGHRPDSPQGCGIPILLLLWLCVSFKHGLFCDGLSNLHSVGRMVRWPTNWK